MKIHLQDFEIPKSAKFYKIKKPITKKKIEDCFDELSKEKKDDFLHYEIKKSKKTSSGKRAKVSSTCFKIENKVSFLKNTNETKHAFIILIEFDKYLAVFQKNCSNPFAELSENLDLFTSSELSSYIDENKNPCCEKLSVNGMSVGKYDILRKSYEAHNLIDSLPTFNSHRLIPRAAKFSEDKNNYSISINTNRITEYSIKDSIQNIINWCFSFKSRIEKNTTHKFMEQFSSSVDLKKLPPDIFPTGVLINANRLIETIDGNLELHHNSVPISDTRRKRLLRASKEMFTIKETKEKTYTLIKNRLFLEQNEKSFTIKSHALSKYSIYDTNNGTRKTILSFLNSKGCFDITFSELSYFYTNKRLYKDSNMIQNVRFIVGIYEPVESFKYARTEKEEKIISKNSIKFPTHSLFHKVEEHYKNQSDIIICDDLGSKEWADHFIFKKVKSGTPSITLVHSKAKIKTSHGASEMQEVVSQAIKNLGKVILSDSDIEDKKNLWTKGYSPSIRTPNGKPKVQSFNSKINRITYLPNFNFSHIKRHIIDIVSSPNCQREVVLAVNFVEKKHIDGLIIKAMDKELSSHESQLLWLMSSFVSSCIEVGVRPKVLCCP
ncbi:hypothetical protein [Serratia marcescens]|uniref:hypothetical protein n=1 Tax=Serratia marcescens TaxID=615 RepID=UPI001F06D7EA|nr:hypothetical protein [Serratia marcescens]UMK46445.1 hypothetical protein L2D51_15460 [Serratia marcescens]